MRAFVEFRHMASTLSLPSTNADVVQLRKDFEELKLDIEDILRDQNDINESTRMQLDAISTALSELQSKEPHASQDNEEPLFVFFCCMLIRPVIEISPLREKS